MHSRLIGAIAIVAGLSAAIGAAQAYDHAKYTNLRGQWTRAQPVQWDATKPPARGQQAPLTPEYQSIWEASLAEQRKGGQEYKPQVRCTPSGMPQMMIGYEPFEFIVTPEMTFMRMVYMHEYRHIYTDGRAWPEKLQPSFAGHSIGKWLDEDGDGRYDVLDIETRGFRGPRIVDPTGIPLHADNQTVIKERIYLDKADPNRLYDEITVIDHALTRPWTITKKYLRKAEKHPVWRETVCAENNHHMVIGTENYFLSAEGYLMPAKKDQPPPDLRYFNKARK